jgi:hypothetical protein
MLINLIPAALKHSFSNDSLQLALLLQVLHLLKTVGDIGKKGSWGLGLRVLGQVPGVWGAEKY